MKLQLQFLGVGSATQKGLGHAAAAVLLDSGKKLLIDCGPGTIQKFKDRYGSLPDAVFVTHCHLDHIADFEILFIQAWFQRPAELPKIKIYVHASIVPLLHQRVASYPSVLAEGGVNFWDAFQLLPVSDAFVFDAHTFAVHEVRHHAPKTAYGLHSPGAFFYTGDTRPIPETLTHSINANEAIFHDCSVVGNPSHSGIDDLLREYDDSILSRLYCYHYASDKDVPSFEQHGLRVVTPEEAFSFDV